MGEDHDQQAEEHQVEHQPGHQEPAPPHTHTVRGHAAVRKVLNQFNTEIREKCFFQKKILLKTSCWKANRTVDPQLFLADPDTADKNL